MAITLWVGDAVADKKSALWEAWAESAVVRSRATEQELFASCLRAVMQSNPTVSVFDDSLFIKSQSDVWLCICKDGTIEFGESGV